MENNTNLYNPNTGKLLEAGQTVYDQNTGNKIIQGSPFSLPRNINTVGADQINDQRNITTPDMQPALYNSDLAGTVNGLVVGSKTQSATDLADQTRRDDLATSRQDINSKFGSLLDVNTELGAVSSNIDRTAENNARKQVDQYTSDIEQMQRESDKRIKNFMQTFGGTTAGANAEALKMQREDLSAQADKALLLSAATRNYSTLNAIAEQQVINKTAELTAKSENLKAYIEMNKADFDKKEQRLYDEEQKKVDANLKKQTENEEYIKSIKINMAQSGNINSSVMSALNKIDTTKPDAMEKILNIKGISSYTISSSDKLDLQLKKAQISNINSQISERNKNQKVENATQAKERQDKEKSEAQKKAQVPIIKEKINLIASIFDSSGLNTRVGPSALGLPTRTFFGARDSFGAGQDFASAVQQLTNQDTLATLLELKAAGGTLGAVSEKELDLLQKAASKINAWEVKGKDGIGKGQWNISEKKFKEELEILRSSSQALYESLGGLDAEQGQLNGFLDIVDGALQSSDSIYSQSGYSL